MKRTIKIHIGGQQYILRSDADESYVQALADSVNARLDAFKGSRQVATQSDVVLAALKLADELEHEKQSQARLRTQVRGQVELMLGQVEAQLQASPLETPLPSKAALPTRRESRGQRGAPAVSRRAR